MNEKDFYMPAFEMRERIKTQELSSQEITEHFIERIKEINPKVNAYCTPTFELAREMAKKADKAAKDGKELGPLMGIPTSIKDLMQTKGIRTTYGSKLYENFIPEQDDIAVRRLKDAGCVIMGKTNTPEFGHIALTRNMIFGETKNPWDLEKNSGGSSGGAAASVASGIGPLALGSDGGGSIRIPSSCCGVYGLKPTFGRIPSYPRIGIAFRTMDHYGPITRFVKDAALMLNVMKGFHSSDYNSLPDNDIDYVKALEEKPKKVKIGYSMDLRFAKGLVEEVRETVLNSIQKFDQVGWEVEKAKLKIRNPELAFKSLVAVGYAYDLKKAYEKRQDDLSPDLIPQVKFGLDSDSISIGKAKEVRIRTYETMDKYFKKYDLLITPTIPCLAFKPEWLERGTLFPKVGKMRLNIVSWMTFTYPFNMTGLPAASIPCGWSSENTPIGMQIVGKRFDEKTVLQVSKAFEEIAPWQDKKPNL
jgi:Asp-tRNA(Asn)/Glu-tRNA(Gln) amidotransferase A subunit family amidase